MESSSDAACVGRLMSSNNSRGTRGWTYSDGAWAATWLAGHSSACVTVSVHPKHQLASIMRDGLSTHGLASIVEPEEENLCVLV